MGCSTQISSKAGCIEFQSALYKDMGKKFECH